MMFFPTTLRGGRVGNRAVPDEPMADQSSPGGRLTPLAGMTERRTFRYAAMLPGGEGTGRGWSRRDIPSPLPACRKLPQRQPSAGAT